MGLFCFWGGGGERGGGEGFYHTLKGPGQKSPDAYLSIPNLFNFYKRVQMELRRVKKA